MSTDRAPNKSVSFDPLLPACVFCGSGRIAAYDRDYLGRTVQRCGDCRVLFMNPQFSDAWLAEFYGEYIPEASSEESDAERAAKAPVHHYHLELIEKAGPVGRLLSVGCGSGVELEVARQRGWQVEGYDVDDATVKRVAAKLQVEIRSGKFLEIPYQKGAYDCVYLHHVLEHPKNPQAYLRRIHEILKPGGVLFIACPNLGSVSNVTKTALGKVGLKGKRGKHYDTWHHLFYYSPAVLAPILERHFGYEVVQTVNGLKGRDRGGFFSLETRARVNGALPCFSSIFLLVARRPR